MTEAIKLDIKRTGFPVKVGDIELWFDSSAENLKRYLKADEIAREKLKEAEKKMQHIHFPADIKNIDVTDLKDEELNAAFDLNKEFIATQYNIYFGDGTFKMIYEKYPDIFALEELLEPLGVAISEKILEQEQKRKEEKEAVEKSYLDKKKQKRKADDKEGD